MPESKSRDWVVKVGDGGSPSETFTAIASIRSKTATINNAPVDITTDDNAPFRTLAEDVGLRSMEMNFSGVYTDSATQKGIIDKVLAGTNHNMQILDGTTGDYFEGAFQFTSIQLTGNFDGVIEFSGTLQSSGAITFEVA